MVNLEIESTRNEKVFTEELFTRMIEATKFFTVPPNKFRKKMCRFNLNKENIFYMETYSIEFKKKTSPKQIMYLLCF